MNSLIERFRPEAAANLRLALPLIAAQLTFMAWGVMDTLMAGRMGAGELAAVAVGANIWMQVFVFFMGVCIACSPIVAQRSGAGESRESIGAFAREALLLAVLLGLVWIALVRVLASPTIKLLGLAPHTSALAYEYLMAESWSGVLFALCFTLRNVAEGLSLSRVVLWAGLAALSAKAVFNLLLVPHWGVPGLGWASVAASAMLLLAYLVQYRWNPGLHALRLLRPGRLRLDVQGMEVLRLGLPIGFILFAEVAFFGCTALLMARFGDHTVAAHQVAINFASLTFMIPLGIGMATAVRVGQAAGGGEALAARLRGFTGMQLAALFSLFSAALMVLGAEQIAHFYSRDPQVAEIASTFLRLAAIFQLFDCLQAVAGGALRGYKDTRLPMLITVAAYWLVGMPASYALAFGLGYGPNALWWGFTLGLGVAALGLGLRLRRLSAAPRPQGSLLMP